MIYAIVRMILPVYMVMLAVLLTMMFADLLFQKKKRKLKVFTQRLFVSLIWPLALANKNGRSIFFSNFDKL